jgi:hypothetical protein
MDGVSILFLSGVPLRVEQQAGSPVSVCPMVTSDSILVWNHYCGVKIVFAEHSCCEPDQQLACFHYSHRIVTTVTDLEMALH